MARELVFDVPGGRLFYRHSDVDLTRPSLLFLHGLGESGLCFIEAFREPALSGFNIFVPDLVGFGKSWSDVDADYCFTAQIKRICALLDRNKIQTVYVVGHSMGGDIGTELCRLEPQRVVAFINVEGSLTPSDRFITDLALKADEDGRFDTWLRDDFRRGMVHQWSVNWPTCIRYAASLEMCQPEAFRQSAREIYLQNSATSDSGAGLIGERYRKLNLRRVYCWGAESLSPESRTWLSGHSELLHQRFDGAFHWVMLDQSKSFYQFVSGFIRGCAETGLTNPRGQQLRA